MRTRREGTRGQGEEQQDDSKANPREREKERGQKNVPELIGISLLVLALFRCVHASL